MMYMRMGTAAKARAKYWVDRFKSRLLPEDDLHQESYLMFLRCQDFYDPEGRGSFLTYYSRALRNHFINLYRKARRQERIERLILNSPEEKKDEDSNWALEWAENAISDAWTVEDIIEWEDMVDKISSQLSGRLLGIFLILIAPTEELIDLSLGSSGNITNTSIGRFFGVKRTTIEDQRKRIEDLVRHLMESEDS